MISKRLIAEIQQFRHSGESRNPKATGCRLKTCRHDAEKWASTKLGNFWLIVVMVTALVMSYALVLPASLYAEDLQIVPAADSFSESDAAGYVGSPVSAVTASALGAPTMVRNNVSDSGLIDYVYVGNSTVYTFEVQRSAKGITAYRKTGRGAWESSVYPAYS